MIQEAQHVCATCGKVCEHPPELTSLAAALVAFVFLVGAISIVQWIAGMNRRGRG